jgi:hypothetical protein
MKRWHSLFLALLAAAVLPTLTYGGPPAGVPEYCSSSGCLDCDWESNDEAKCVSLNYVDGWCVCNAGYSDDPGFCSTGGHCTYESPFPNPWGPPKPGAGGVCLIQPATWCPPECTSCTVWLY